MLPLNNELESTLGSRGYLFLIDAEAALTQKKSAEEKKI